MKIGFLLFIIPFLALIAICSVVIFKSAVTYGLIQSVFAKKFWIWVLILLPVILIVTMAVSNKVYSAVNAFFYTIAATWLAVLLYLFFAAVLLAIILLIARATGSVPNITTFIPYPFMYQLAIAALMIALGAATYGIINATQPRIVSYDITSPALSKMWSGKNIVLVSDTHLGIIRGAGFMQKVVDKINAQDPDLVLIAGDIIDGPVFNYEKGLAPLKDITSTFGTIYTPGNHEGYNREPEKFYPIVRKLTATIVDSSVEINDTTIVGLDYKPESFEATNARLRKITDESVKLGEEENLPIIAILHDPRNTDALLDAGVSLVVSGHTHCGQFFPINVIVKGIYKNHTYGVVNRAGDKSDSTIATNRSGVSVTTCGVGTSMSPLRLGTNPEIVVLHIK